MKKSCKQEEEEEKDSPSSKNYTVHFISKIVKFVNVNVNELSIGFRHPASHLKEYRRDEHTGPFVATVL